MNVKLEKEWANILKEEFEKSYFIELVRQIKNEILKGKIIYPPGKLIFNAFDKTPWNELKVVILGQDPYHGDGEAMGLSFSVPKGVKIPPSLKNIYKEVMRTENILEPQHGDLSYWAIQGVLLLNASLTVEKDLANSHKQMGWHQFTDAVIRTINDQKSNIVFMLWGNFAKSKMELIDQNKHLVLTSTHPSPLAGNSFIGNDHFKVCNHYLEEKSLGRIDWSII
ncbi:MAG TPA: uracil-DNA glycosylase [Saprospiraceae bacterium]|nr:uracil-DNA glycosylase [Saprospiraceae bacterium]